MTVITNPLGKAYVFLFGYMIHHDDNAIYMGSVLAHYPILGGNPMQTFLMVCFVFDNIYKY